MPCRAALLKQLFQMSKVGSTINSYAYNQIGSLASLIKFIAGSQVEFYALGQGAGWCCS
jgi:hypothetical protein